MQFAASEPVARSISFRNLTPAPTAFSQPTRAATLSPNPIEPSPLIPISAQTSPFLRISAEQAEKNASAIVIEASSESEGIDKEKESLEREFPRFQKVAQRVSFN